MNRSLRNKLSIAAALVGVAAFGGGAYAATKSNNTNPRQAYLSDLAKRLGTTQQKLNQALQGAFFDRLDAAVAAGKLTKAQADAIKRRVQQDGAVPFGVPGLFGHREHRGVFGPPGGPGGRHGLLRAAANYLGLSEAQLVSQLQSGHSLAQVAKSRSKSTSGLQNAMLAAAKSRLDGAVKAKRLSSSQETQILNRLKSDIGRMINHAPPSGMHRGGLGPRGGGFFGRPDGPPGAPPGGAADFGGAAPPGNPPAGVAPQAPGSSTPY